MIALENEVKHMLSKESYIEFMNLSDAYFEFIDHCTNTNHYFEEVSGKLSELGFSFKIRIKRNQSELTIKKKISTLDGVYKKIEFTMPVKRNSNMLIIDFNELMRNDKVITFFKRYGVEDILTLKFNYLGVLITERSIFYNQDLDENYNVDKSIYCNNEDYEIECETLNDEKWLSYIESLLNKHNLKYSTSMFSKTERFRRAKFGVNS